MDVRRLNSVQYFPFLIAILGSSVTAHAANNCPWLNEATASGVLGGDATGEYAPALAGKAAACTFTQLAPGGFHQLIISVEIAANPHDRVMELIRICGAGSEMLAGIGNEAETCAVSAGGKIVGERVIGRVRDQVFTISITTTGNRDSFLDAHELAMRSQTAAEQVSGNLF